MHDVRENGAGGGGRLHTAYLFPLVAIAVTALFYGRFLDNFFVFDDFKYLENMYRSASDVVLGYGSLRIVSNLSWWPLFAVSGFNPLGYNLFALFLFMANGVVLYVLLRRLLNDTSAAFLAGTFFMAGSVGADAVFWKASNSSLISLLFYLLTLHFYVGYRQSGRRGTYHLSVAFFVLAMFSKEEAASLPFMVAVIDLLFFDGRRDITGVVRRVAPFCAVIVVYVATNFLVFNYLLHGKAEPEKLFRFRPLYSLVGGGTAFYLSPDGFVRLDHPLVYALPVLILLAFFLVKEKRLLAFGCLWIFFAFLPQSLTGLGQFEPRVIVNSISRYLYITSIGSSLVFAAILLSFRGKMPKRGWYAVSLVVVLLYGWFHFGRIQARGEEWRAHGEVVEQFIKEVIGVVPAFPDHAYVHVVNGPTGRAFIQQSLRAFYGNPGITWVDDPRAVELKGNDALFVILYRVIPGKAVEVMRLR